MGEGWRLLTLVVLCVYFLTTFCHACKRARKATYENRRCALWTQVITGFPRGISEHSLKHPVCSAVLSSVFDTETIVADWRIVLDRKNKWAQCPKGYFLQGFKFKNHEKGVYAVEEGRCTKSNKLRNKYGHCYNEPTSRTSHCRREGYYLAGIYRGDCSGWGCISQLRCCSMTFEVSVDSVKMAKDKVMARSLNGLAQLASILGYDGTKGCFGEQPGDNFEKDGYSWKAKKCPRKNNSQLKISYGDWKLSVSDVKYSDTETTELTPITIDSGINFNPQPFSVVQAMTGRYSTVRTVKHSLSGDWNDAVAAGAKVTYTPPNSTLDVGDEFSFSIAEGGGEKTVNKDSFELKRELVIEPYKQKKWEVRMRRTRTIQLYAATVRMECSAQLEGNLRKERNYHSRYAGRSKNNVTYRFGDKDTPFFVAVKNEKEQRSHPWKWGSLVGQQPWVKYVVGYLANQTNYEFVVGGYFEEVHTHGVQIEESNLPL